MEKGTLSLPPEVEAVFHEFRTGELREEAGVLILRPGDFLTGSGRQDTDRMPYAGSPLDIMRYMILGRRKAREYLAKGGKPWPPPPWSKMLRYLDEP